MRSIERRMQSALRTVILTKTPIRDVILMKVLKIALAMMLIVLIIAAAYLYKGDLSAEYVDEKYSNDASQFLMMENGARVHYRDEGDESKPVIVLVHGSNASLHTWEPWVEIMKSDYRVISMDLPAHGLTGATPDKDYSSQAQVNTVQAIVSHLDVDSFVLGGNSMGGGVTWRYTLQYPEKVQAMLLVDSSGLPQFRRRPVADDGESKDSPLIFTLMSKAWFRAAARYLDPYFLTVQGLKSAYNNSPVVTDELIDRYYELAIREGSREATISRFSGFGSRSSEPVDVTYLNMPALIMWGAEDALIPVSVADQFATALENTTLVVYDDVGHAPMEEIAERSAADVVSFLEAAGIK
jgi:pimeloyl-ACP methyl ester carboxylesterase